MQGINVFFQIFILVFSVMIHEISHGLMALSFGDRTAEYEGRLTLNPLKHIDLFGSIVVPLMLWISGAGFMIGWAKPVPYNPYNLRNRRVGEMMVALAGPLSNLLVAVLFGLLIRFLPLSGPLLTIFVFIVLVNITLSMFNLVPVPPLDGSKILFSILPVGERFVFSRQAQQYGLIALIIIVIFLLRMARGLIDSFTSSNDRTPSFFTSEI